MELMLLYIVSYYEILELISEFNSLSGLVVSGGDELELMSESGVGVAALYSCSMWLIIVSV